MVSRRLRSTSIARQIQIYTFTVLTNSINCPSAPFSAALMSCPLVMVDVSTYLIKLATLLTNSRIFSFPSFLTNSSNPSFCPPNFRTHEFHLDCSEKRSHYLISHWSQFFIICLLIHTLYQRLLRLRLHFGIPSIFLRSYAPHLPTLPINLSTPQPNYEI